MALTSLIDTFKVIVGRRWPLILGFFAVELTVIVLVSNSSFLPSEMAVYERQYNSTTAVLGQTASVQGVDIFANNFRVAIYELVPLIGFGVFGLSLYETARIVEVIGILHGENVGLALATLFLLPSTWLELPAYAIAAAESFYLLSAIIRGFRTGWGRLIAEVRYLIANVILIAGVLITAATFETTEIQLEQGPPQTQVYVFLTWVPFIIVLVGVVAFWRRSRKDAPIIEEKEQAEKGFGLDPAPEPQPAGPPPQTGGGEGGTF